MITVQKGLRCKIFIIQTTFFEAKILAPKGTSWRSFIPQGIAVAPNIPWFTMSSIPLDESEIALFSLLRGDYSRDEQARRSVWDLLIQGLISSEQDNAELICCEGKAHGTARKKRGLFTGWDVSSPDDQCSTDTCSIRILEHEMHLVKSQDQWHNDIMIIVMFLITKYQHSIHLIDYQIVLEWLLWTQKIISNKL